ncbi:MAG: hypothetical protein IJ736_08945, partial [Firmicutes bacterium]|nr:hypothetical protein [Bacillota bacterium]
MNTNIGAAAVPATTDLSCFCFFVLLVIVFLIVMAVRKKNNKNSESINENDIYANQEQMQQKYGKNTNQFYKPNVNANNSYDKSVYFTETHITYDEMMADKGKSGEYSISRELEKISGFKKIMFNTYLPTEKVRTTE